MSHQMASFVLMKDVLVTAEIGLESSSWIVKLFKDRVEILQFGEK